MFFFNLIGGTQAIDHLMVSDRCRPYTAATPLEPQVRCQHTFPHTQNGKSGASRPPSTRIYVTPVVPAHICQSVTLSRSEIFTEWDI